MCQFLYLEAGVCDKGTIITLFKGLTPMAGYGCVPQSLWGMRKAHFKESQLQLRGHGVHQRGDGD